MIAHIPIKCPYCKKTHNVSEEEIGDLLSHMKMNKVMQVAQQMHDKSGPFYDRWVAAMAAKGPQMRCEDCMSHHVDTPGLPENYCMRKLKVVNPGCFACEYISYYKG